VSRRPFAIAGDDLYLVDAGQLLALSKLNVLEDKRPDVVAEPVSVEVALEDELVLDTIGQRVVDALVKLKQDSQREIGRDLTQLNEFVQAFLQCMPQRRVSV